MTLREHLEAYLKGYKAYHDAVKDTRCYSTEDYDVRNAENRERESVIKSLEELLTKGEDEAHNH